MSLSKWNEDKNWSCEQAVLPADDKETRFSTHRGKNNERRAWMENRMISWAAAARNPIKIPGMLFKGEDGHHSLCPITV